LRVFQIVFALPAVKTFFELSVMLVGGGFVWDFLPPRQKGEKNNQKKNHATQSSQGRFSKYIGADNFPTTKVGVIRHQIRMAFFCVFSS
jgi:hypothetical protein